MFFRNEIRNVINCKPLNSLSKNLANKFSQDCELDAEDDSKRS